MLFQLKIAPSLPYTNLTNDWSMKAIGSIATFLGFAFISFTGLQIHAGAMVGSSQLNTASKLSWNELVGFALLLIGVILVMFKKKNQSDLRKQ